MPQPYPSGSTYIWGYRREMAPRVRALLAEHAGYALIHIVRSRRAANQLTEQLQGATVPQTFSPGELLRRCVGALSA